MGNLFRIDPNDWQVFDLVEDVTLTKVDPDGTQSASYPCVGIPEPTIAGNPVDVGGVQMTPQTVSWHLKSADLPPGVSPERGDRIVSTSDSYSGVWVVMSSDNVRDGLQAVCRTQKLLQP